MRFSRVSVASVAHVEAPHRVTSRELEEQLSPLLRRLGLASGAISALSGVEARRFWDADTQPSFAAAHAGERALAKAGIDRKAIGALVSTSVCRDFVEPSTASVVHRALGLSPRCRSFDLGNACLGFIDGMEMVATLIEHGSIDYALVVDGEGSRFTVERTIERLNQSGGAREFAEEFATLTLGSGGAAMVLARSDLVPDGHRFSGGVRLSDTQNNDLCRGHADRMVTHAQRLLQAGLDLAGATFELARAELGWEPRVLDEIVIHQVSRQHTERLAQRLGVELDRILPIYAELGNVGPASIPIALSMAEQRGRLTSGTRVALMGIGSGISCAMAEVLW
jgi:acyl-CoA:acyl-CoA alkyltransferase